MMRTLTNKLILMLVFAGSVIGLASAAVAPLTTESGSPAAMHNQSGMQAYNQGAWEKAYGHFQIANQKDPQSAVVHYNLGLALHKIEEHQDAAYHFQKAAELGPNQSRIQQSNILQEHLEMLN